MKGNARAIDSTLLQGIIACPYRYYFQNNLGIFPEKLTWQHVIQDTVNQIVKSYFELSYNERSSIQVLRLIHTYWERVNRYYFESISEYLRMFVMVSDHLLHFLLSEKEKTIPFFLFERSNNLPSNRHSSSLINDLVTRTENSYVIKKVLIETNERLLTIYYNAIKAFSLQAFGDLPEQIEIIDLQTAQRIIHIPKPNETLSEIEENFMVYQTYV
ncbi:hypothetical protein [Bacillus solitudinis]|uniref:hypothetical protein n=1 Tax=Bacillus solitudinis TaxID=2014074 RepID=UPI000C251114|nr:hypothetical protein [Bacillus solitudinis]